MTPSDAEQNLAHDAEQQRQRILSMKPGADLNVEVGRAIFGIKRFYSYDGRPWEPGATDWPQYIPSGKPWRTHSIDAVALPRFSEEAGAAWLVVEHLCTDGLYVFRASGPIGHRYPGYRFGFTLGGLSVHTSADEVEAETFPLAVCRAALLATLEALPR